MCVLLLVSCVSSYFSASVYFVVVVLLDRYFYGSNIKMNAKRKFNTHPTSLSDYIFQNSNFACGRSHFWIRAGGHCNLFEHCHLENCLDSECRRGILLFYLANPVTFLGRTCMNASYTTYLMLNFIQKSYDCQFYQTIWPDCELRIEPESSNSAASALFPNGPNDQVLLRLKPNAFIVQLRIKFPIVQLWIKLEEQLIMFL